MSIKLYWINEDRLMYVRLNDVVKQQILTSFITQIKHMTQHNKHSFDMIVDCRQASSVDISFNSFRKLMQNQQIYESDISLKSYLHICNNPQRRQLVNIIGAYFGVIPHFVPTLHQALAYVKQYNNIVDRSLQPDATKLFNETSHTLTHIKPFWDSDHAISISNQSHQLPFNHYLTIF